MSSSLSINIEYKDGFYYWVLKDENGVTNNWATSLGGVFEQIIADKTKRELISYDRNKHTSSLV